MAEEAQIKEALDAWVAEALDLRFNGLPVIEVGAHAQDVLSALLQVRQRADRVDALLSQATQLKARVGRSSLAAKYAAEDSWDQELQKDKQSTVRRNQSDFDAPRERYSRANLASFEEQRASRKAEVLKSLVDECYDLVRGCKFGLDGLRSDLVAILRAYSFESHLER